MDFVRFLWQFNGKRLRVNIDEFVLNLLKNSAFMQKSESESVQLEEMVSVFMKHEDFWKKFKIESEGDMSVIDAFKVYSQCKSHKLFAERIVFECRLKRHNEFEVEE